MVEAVTNNYSSLVGMRIGARLLIFAEEHELGYVTGEAGGYMVTGERYTPDVAFISKARQPEPCHDLFNPNAPDLAVEVLAPTDKPADMRIKFANYLAAGTAVWIVNPDSKMVEVYGPGQPVRIIGLDGTLDGGDLLPGFELAVKDIFPE
jgi:Uma2 family endonuclease